MVITNISICYGVLTNFNIESALALQPVNFLFKQRAETGLLAGRVVTTAQSMERSKMTMTRLQKSLIFFGVGLSGMLTVSYMTTGSPLTVLKALFGS
jgi:hypothetical protein